MKRREIVGFLYWNSDARDNPSNRRLAPPPVTGTIHGREGKEGYLHGHFQRSGEGTSVRHGCQLTDHAGLAVSRVCSYNGLVRACRPVMAFVLALLISHVVVPGAPAHYPVDDLQSGMVGIGRTVFSGDRLEEFTVHVLGVLRNVNGPRRDLVLARLEGGPLATTGVIAGMSGSPVYIDGRLLGAVSYSLGSFSREPIAGITPIGEMIEAAALKTPRRQLARIASLTPPTTAEAVRVSLRQAFSMIRPFADRPSEVRVLGGDGSVSGSIGTMLRPIATPLSLSGFDGSSAEPVLSTFRDLGFVPVLTGGSTQQEPQSLPALRPGDPIGVTLMSGDLEVGATGTVTHIEGDAVYAFGHPFYNLGPTQFPMTRAWVHAVLPSLESSMKIASTGQVIGTVSQDRATTIAGTIGPGPALIPIELSLASDRGIRKTFHLNVVHDQLFAPLMTYLSIAETLGSYQRQTGVSSFVVRGSVTLKNHGRIDFEDLFSGEQAVAGAAGYIMTPVNVLLRNIDEDVTIERLSLDIDASERQRTATLERVWIDDTRLRAGATVPLKMLLRTYRGDEVTRTLPLQIPANARGAISVMVTDGRTLTRHEARGLSPQAASARGVSQLVRAFNVARKHDRLYVRLVTRDRGAVVRGEALASLPPSVLTVIESERGGGSVLPLQSALLGEWEVGLDHVVSGSRTITLPLDRH